MKISNLTLMTAVLAIFLSCSKDTPPAPQPGARLIIKFKFDGNQERLNNLGEPSAIPDGNAAQTPNFNFISSHYIELAQSTTTLLGKGDIIYQGKETNAGGSKAIDFNQAILVEENEEFISVPLKSVEPGIYNWVRVSLSYQEYEIDVLNEGVDYTGTLASFVGYNNYITSFELNGNTIVVNSNKLQGYWAFETQGVTIEGQAPEGATTVPNPLFNTSPIPQGSCVVTGQFEDGLTITGNETHNIEITLSLSINNSFEWEEVNEDGKYEPSAGEKVVDMGLRGLIPLAQIKE